MPIPLDERQRIEAAVAGDRESLERLLLDHYSPLAQWLAPRIPASLRAVVAVDDVVQQTFAQVFRDLNRYQPRDGIAFIEWLRAIADNRLRDEIRAAGRQKRGGGARQIGAGQTGDSVADLLDSLLAGGSTASRSLARREAVQALVVAVSQLPPNQQQAVRLHFLEGWTLDETAARMACTQGAVRGLLVRGKEQLRQALDRASVYLTSK